MIQLTIYLKKGVDSFKVGKTTFYPTTSKNVVNIESEDLNNWLKPEFKKLKIKL